MRCRALRPNWKSIYKEANKTTLDFTLAILERNTTFRVKTTARNVWTGSTFRDVTKSNNSMKSLYESENLINPHCPKCLDSRNFWDSTRLWMLTHKHEPVAAGCHLSLRACNRSLFARGLSIDSRAYVISQHEHCVPPAPIRPPEW